MTENEQVKGKSSLKSSFKASLPAVGFKSSRFRPDANSVSHEGGARNVYFASIFGEKRPRLE